MSNEPTMNDRGLPEAARAPSAQLERLWAETMRAAGFRRHTRASFARLAKRGARLPYDDHALSWYKPQATGGPLHVFVSQPYENTVRGDGVTEMQKACDEHGLSMSIRPDLSWWYPGKTTLVIIARPETMKLLSLPPVRPA